MWTQKSCESSSPTTPEGEPEGSSRTNGDPLQESGRSLASDAPPTGPTRFPKVTNADVRKVENHRGPSPTSAQRVGLPQMNSNMMRLSTPPPRSQTIHHYQSETETLPTLWEERFSFGEHETGNHPHGGFQTQRSRSYYQAPQSYQGQERNQEWNYDGPYSQPNPNQRIPKARSCQNPSYRSPFQQSEQFRGLPLEIYRRLCEEIPGMIITDYFGTAVTVARLHNDNIMEFGMCHVIFAINSATDQYWLKAFTKKTRTQKGNVLKFSRILTANICLEFCGKTAVLVGPANSTRSSDQIFWTEEKHMFNFFEENEAARFIEALDKGMKQVWNRSEMRRKSEFDRGGVHHSQQVLRQESTSRPSSRNRPTNPMSSVNQQRTSRPNTATNSMMLEQNYYSDPQQQGSSASGSYYEVYAPGMDQTSNIRFRAPRVQVFVKVRTAYTLLGVGEISIVNTDEGHDNLVFIGPQGQILCDHLIYSWNQPKVFQQNGYYECTWAAAANLLITINPRQMPSIRDFKLVGNQDVVLKFNETLQQSASRALTKRNTTASAHIDQSIGQQRLALEATLIGNQGESDQQ